MTDCKNKEQCPKLLEGNIIKKKMNLKKTFMLFLFLSSITQLISCSDNEEAENYAGAESIHYELQKEENKEDALYDMFKTDKHVSLSIDYSLYDFDRAYRSEIKEKNVFVYMIPTKDSDNYDNLLVGIGNNKEICAQTLMRKSGDNEYTLYNDENEPVFSIEYDIVKRSAVVTKTYGSDIAPYRQTRVRGGWFTVSCNIAIAVACYTAGAVGAVPTGGASVGLCVCSTVIALACC